MSIGKITIHSLSHHCYSPYFPFSGSCNSPHQPAPPDPPLPCGRPYCREACLRGEIGQSGAHGPAPPIRVRISPGFPPGPVPAARFRKNAAIIRVPGGVFTSEKVRPYLAAFRRSISSSCGLWHVAIERRRFFRGCDPGIGTHGPAHLILRRRPLSGRWHFPSNGGRNREKWGRNRVPGGIFTPEKKGPK